eukprot:scaffold441369_cov14-Prasinocladus_malaysianus.AAC.2
MDPKLNNAYTHTCLVSSPKNRIPLSEAGFVQSARLPPEFHQLSYSAATTAAGSASYRSI